MNPIPACISIFCCFFTPLECQINHEGLEKQALQQMSAIEGVRFLESLIEEINFQHGLNLNLSDASRIVKANIDQLAIPLDMRRELLSIADQFESGAFSISGKRIREAQSWKFGSKKKTKTTRQEELILPDKLAAGFACAFAGALLCIVPGGQGVGLTLIGTGLALAIDGMSEGERPYYGKPIQ